MSDVEHSTIQTDDKFHHYSSNTIPWYVRLMWLGFWIFTVVYTIRFLFPAIQVELFTKM
ncbi:MAG: hypothetical protein KDA87_04265 [Planctomycetales bacterium]|nr:hypothetical protein [Planctomycetales bacterium]